MKKSSKWLGFGGGVLSSIVGVLGTIVLVACPCKVAALSGILVLIFGASAAVYIQKYSWIFIIIGAGLVCWSVYSTISSKKKKCGCGCDKQDESQGADQIEKSSDS